MKGHITTKRGKMVAIITLPYDPVKKRYPQKQLTAKPYETKQELTIRMNAFIAEMEKKDLSNIKRLTVKNFLETWIQTRESKIAKTTYNSYKIFIDSHIVPYLGDKVLAEVKPMDIENFYDHELEQGLNPNTTLRSHTILVQAFKYAYKNKMLFDNPMLYVDRPKVKDKFKPNVYSAEDFHKLLDVVAGTIDEVYVMLAGGLGLRASEIFGLKWTDFDFVNNTVYIHSVVVRTKGGMITKEPKNPTSKRHIAFGDSLSLFFQDWKKRQDPPSEFVVNKYNSNTYSNHFRELLKKHNLKSIRFHDLRHFNATYMLQQGIPDKVAAQRLGHSTVNTTREIYQHVLEEMNHEAAKKIDALF
jgi:integrase